MKIKKNILLKGIGLLFCEIISLNAYNANNNIYSSNNLNINQNSLNILNGRSITNFDSQLKKANKILNEKVNKVSSNKEPTKKDYMIIIRELEKKDGFGENIVLGTIYAYGIWGRNKKKIILEANPNKSYYYFLRAYKKYKYPEALLYLTAILIENKLMHKTIDPKYKLAKKYINEYLKIKPGSMDGLFWQTIIYGYSNDLKNFVKNLTLLATKYNDSDSQLMLALYFKNGLYSIKDGMIIKPNIETANYFLNMACTNPSKSKNVKNFCFDSNIVEKINKSENKKINRKIITEEDITESEIKEKKQIKGNERCKILKSLKEE